MLDFFRNTLRGKCFVSHSYSDISDLESLKQAIGSHANLFVFPPITVTPEEMVSNELLKAIDDCKSLVYLTGKASLNSPWVTLERDYALRAKKRVFSFDAITKQLKRDRSLPMELPVFPSYTRSDGEQVNRLLRVMKDERFFDLFVEEDLGLGEEIARSIEKAIMSRLERGGYVVGFWTKVASESEWVRQELLMAFEKFPKQILIAQLDDTVMPGELADLQPVRLYNPKIQNVDMNRVDDLIVRIYWLIERNRKET